jgi:hypothetical protein
MEESRIFIFTPVFLLLALELVHWKSIRILLERHEWRFARKTLLGDSGHLGDMYILEHRNATKSYS